MRMFTQDEIDSLNREELFVLMDDLDMFEQFNPNHATYVTDYALKFMIISYLKKQGMMELNDYKISKFLKYKDSQCGDKLLVSVYFHLEGYGKAKFMMCMTIEGSKLEINNNPFSCIMFVDGEGNAYDFEYCTLLDGEKVFMQLCKFMPLLGGFKRG